MQFLNARLNIKPILGITLLIFGFLLESQRTFARNLVLEQGSAEIIKLPAETSEIFIVNDTIADVQLNSPTVAYIFGKKPGTTTLFSTSKKGQQDLKLNLMVVPNISHIKEVIRAIAPEEQVELISTPAGVFIKGKVSSATLSREIENVVSRFIGRKEGVINRLQIASATQVYLKVKIAEVKRSAMNKLNMNWSTASAPGHFNFGVLMGRSALPTGTSTGPAIFNSSPDGLNSLGVQFNDRRTNLSTLIDALNSEGLASILAEPNLVALSGETASFLVGGEFPFPVPQDNNVTIEFKQFGISLAFTPTVLSSNQINLRVRPEVSSLDKTNPLKIALAGGAPAEVPSIQTRRAETSVELGSGQSLAIAGLFTTSLKNNYSEFPGLANIPVLGLLFQSQDFQRDETELVILVTPYLVNPVSKDVLVTSVEGLHHSTQLEMILSKRLNRNPESNKGKTPDAKLVGVAGFHI